MNDKLEILKKERKSIINDYYPKSFLNTEIEKKVFSIEDHQHVIVKEIVEECENVKSFWLAPDDYTSTKELLPFISGQCINVAIDIDGKEVIRTYSISSSELKARNGFYRITIEKVVDGTVSSYFYNEVKVGDRLTISQPHGNFCYNPIRDENNIIAIVNGHGISPILSLAESILDGLYQVSLTVFYNVKSEKDIIFKEEIKKINEKNNNIRIVIINDEENSYINTEILKPYMKEFNTILMSGSTSLYKSMNEVLSKFNIPKKNVHYELFDAEYHPDIKDHFNLKIISRDKEFNIPCKSDETLLKSMEKEGIKAPVLCHVGECGFCRSILVEGKVKTIEGKLLNAEIKNDYIHPCITYPESNIIIKLDI